MNFFQTVFSVCSGTSAFPRLATGSVGKAFFHLFLLLIFCTAGVCLVNYGLEQKKMQVAVTRFFDKTGDIVLSPDKISLEKEDPETVRSYTVGSFRFDYYPNSRKLTPDSLKDMKVFFQILCFPSGMVLRIQDLEKEDTNFSRILIFPVDVLYGIFTRGEVSQQEMSRISREKEKSFSPDDAFLHIRENLLDAEIREKVREAGVEEKAAGAEKSASPYRISYSFVLSRLKFFYILFSILYFMQMALFCLGSGILFFSLSQKIRAQASPNPIPYKVVLNTSIYSAFPPLLIAAFFQALKLSIPPFYLTFFISFFLYQIFTFNAVFRFFNPGMPPEQGKDDSDF